MQLIEQRDVVQLILQLLIEGPFFHSLLHLMQSTREALHVICARVVSLNTKHLKCNMWPYSKGFLKTKLCNKAAQRRNTTIFKSKNNSWRA
jgi:hypothetical protein